MPAGISSVLGVYRERMALTRSPATPTNPVNATVSQPLAGKDVFADPGAGGVLVAGDGLKIGALQTVVISVFANSGQTLSGGGSLFCWVFSPDEFVLTNGVLGWQRAPDFDLSLSWGSAAPQNARIFPALRLPLRGGGRVLFLTNAVTVSGGTDVLVRLQGDASWHAS